MPSARTAKAAAAMLERFAGLATEAAIRASGKSLHHTAPNEAGFAHFYCSLEGHEFSGAPAAWAHVTHGGELEASCPKCVPAKCSDAAAYLAALAAAIGWDPAGDVLHGSFGGRRHIYRTFDDKFELIHAKSPAPDARSEPSWTLRFRELLPDGGYGRTYWPSKLMAAAYPTRTHFYNITRPYRYERILERPPSCVIVVCEGEKDCDSFNELMDVIGNRTFTATCLPHPRPTELEDHQVALLQDREVILVPDADAAGEGNAAAWGTCLREVAKSIKVLSPELLGLVHGDKARSDLSDAIAARKDTGETLTQVAAWLLEVIGSLEPVGDDAFAVRDSWFAQLDRSATTKAVKDTISNARIALTEHPELRGRWRFNVRSGEVEAVGAPWTEAPVVIGRRAIAAAAADWLGGDSARKMALKVATYSDALGLAKVTPPYDPLAPLRNLAWDGVPRLDAMFISLLPLELEQEHAIALARVAMADFGSKLAGELHAQRAIVCLATEQSHNIAGAMLGDHGRLYGGGTVRERELAAFIRSEAAIVQIGMGAITDRQAARVTTPQVFADHVVANDRKISTPYFIALGPEPDRRTVLGCDERTLPIPLRAEPLVDAIRAQFPQIVAELFARREELAATALPTKRQLLTIDTRAGQDELRPMHEAIYLYATRDIEAAYVSPYMLRRAPLRGAPLMAIDRERLLELTHVLLFDDWRGLRDREGAFNAACRALGWAGRGVTPKLTLRRSQAAALGIEIPARRDRVTRPGVHLTPDRLAQLEVALYPPEGPDGGDPGANPPKGGFESVTRHPVDRVTNRVTPNPTEIIDEFTSREGGVTRHPHGMASRGRVIQVQTSIEAPLRDNSKTPGDAGWLEGDAAIAAARAILTTPGRVGFDCESYPTEPSWHGQQAAAAAPRGEQGDARAQAIHVAELAARAHRRQPCTMQLVHEDGREAFIRLAPGDDSAPRRAELCAMFEGRRATLCAHRAQFEAECLLNHGVAADIECTWLMAKTLYAAAVKPQPDFGLAAMVKREFGRVRDKRIRDRDWRLEESLDAEGIEYGLQDARDALALAQLYLPRLEAEGMLEGYRAFAQAILPSAEINRNGLLFDATAHTALIPILRAELDRCRQELTDICGGAIRNHGSGKQVGQWIVHEVMGEGAGSEPTLNACARIQARAGVGWKLTKSGDLVTDKHVKSAMAEALAPHFPRVSEYLLAHLRWSIPRMLLSTFGPSLAAWVDRDGRLRGQVSVGAAVTLRQSAAHPNSQQMPRRREFRELFRAPAGRRLVNCDYEQIELRLAALECPDQALLEVYAQGRDVHAENAALFDAIPLEEFKARTEYKARRNAGKPAGFSLLYGAGTVGLATAVGCTLERAEEIMARFFAAYPGIAAFRERAPREAAARGYIAIRPGRRVRYEPPRSRGPMAVNYPIQGGAAAVQMRAIRRVYDALAARPELDTKLCASIHDEILLESPDDERAAAAAELLQTEMRQALLDRYPEASAMGADRLAAAEVLSSWAEKG
jgi:DNA polymerase I-like protein with 3'-5' exonuclease and polymerase domains